MSQCAPQQAALVRLITVRGIENQMNGLVETYPKENIDLARMYTEPNLDRPTLLYLLDAATSVDVSRQLNNDHTVDVLQTIIDSPACEEEGRRKAASRLLDRIKAWDTFEDALTNTQAPFLDAAMFLKDVTSEENSFGIWLENMMGHKDIQERLHESDQLRPAPHPLALWRPEIANSPNVSHDDFIRFVRACIGVASVVAVYAWADSVPIEECRERALAIIKFWQNVEGYRQVSCLHLFGRSISNHHADSESLYGHEADGVSFRIHASYG